MVSKPIQDLIQSIAKWGKSRGGGIQQAYQLEGDWSPWTQVELALQFMSSFQNVTVTREQKILEEPEVIANLLVAGGGNKKIAISLTCELLSDKAQEAPEHTPGTPPPQDSDKGPENETCEKIIARYEAMKHVDLSQYSPAVMGIMVSKLGNKAAAYYLCGWTGFQSQSLYTDKSGNAVTLYYKTL